MSPSQIGPPAPGEGSEHRPTGYRALPFAVAPDRYDPVRERLEIELLLEGVYRQHGFDFRSYSYASLRRRLWRRARAEGLETVSALQDRVLHDPAVMERLLHDMSINVTAMFRDPDFYRSFREEVVPRLRTYPFVRIWHAGCSTGEEVVSMAILLREEGLHDRVRLYATDMSEVVLQRARSGIFPLARMQEYTENYQRAGGERAFSEYYNASYDGAVFDPSLLAPVVFSQHNLATDRGFSEFHVIVCRNVLIYFDRALQARVHSLFYESLATFGVLGLGVRESMRCSEYEDCYEPVNITQKLFRKVR
ncbi:MAG: CheR family methyltransferase [Gemmatimonadaceae bacterium]